MVTCNVFVFNMSSADPRKASLFGSIGRRHHRLDLCSCDGAGLGSSLGLELSRPIHLLGGPCLYLHKEAGALDPSDFPLRKSEVPSMSIDPD